MSPSASARAHWEQVYSTRADGEVSWYQPRPGTSIELLRRTGVGREASVLDAGGGSSRLVDAILEEGWRRLAVLDVSETALARARARLGARAAEVEWIAADVTAWTPPHRFDVWHDRALFHFLTGAADRKAYLAAVRAAVPPRGHVVIGTFALDGPEQCSGLPVVRYDAASLAREMGPDFALAESLHEDHPTPAGKIQRFQFSRFVRER